MLVPLEFLLHQLTVRLILSSNMSIILEEALKLPVAERIRLADDLYDSVSGSPGSVRLTDEQLEELARRTMAWNIKRMSALAWA